MRSKNIFEELVLHTSRMHESAKLGDWGVVRQLDGERIELLQRGMDLDSLKTNENGLKDMQIMHDRIIDLAKAERNVITREYKEQSARLQNCQAYLKTDRQSEFKD